MLLRIIRAVLWSFALNVYQKSWLTPDNWKFRNWNRAGLPTIAASIVLGGVAAILQGIPAMETFFTDPITDAIGVSYTAAGVVMLLGTIFPRLSVLEAWANIFVLASQASYAVALFILTLHGSETRGFIIHLSLILMVLVFMRLSALRIQWTHSDGQE